MSEINRSRRGINVPVLSFLTRRLIAGENNEFSKTIGQALGVKINAKSNLKTSHQDGRAHVNIAGGDDIRMDIAKRVITELDQNAGLIVANHAIQSKADVNDLHYNLLRSHLTPLLQQACKDLNLIIPAPIDAQAKNISPEEAVTPNIPNSTAQEQIASPAIKRVTKTKKHITIKFNDEAFVPRNLSQAITYVAARDIVNSYVFAAGPFGGGKTFTPLRAAFEGYNESRYDEIILIRPSASTGKDPGAMPGNPRMKMEPYLKGGLASNIEKITTTSLRELEDKKVVRAFTPDFERGESYDRAFILVDEPQNLNVEQAEMLIGRLGEDSMMVFAGDIGGKQNDRQGQISGLAHLIATQADETFTDEYLRDHTAYIKFVDGDSEARNKILSRVSRGLNNPRPAYAALLSAFNSAAPNPAKAKAVEGTREYAVERLEMAAKNTLYRYENQIQATFSGLYKENRTRFAEERPALKIA